MCGGGGQGRGDGWGFELASTPRVGCCAIPSLPILSHPGLPPPPAQVLDLAARFDAFAAQSAGVCAEVRAAQASAAAVAEAEAAAKAAEAAARAAEALKQREAAELARIAAINKQKEEVGGYKPSTAMNLRPSEKGATRHAGQVGTSSTPVAMNASMPPGSFTSFSNTCSPNRQR